MVYQTGYAKEKIMSFKKITMAFVTAFMCMTTINASAEIRVYDNRNHIENIISAIHAVKQLKELIEHTAQLGDANANKQIFLDTFGNSIEINEFLGFVTETQNALKQSQKVMGDLQNIYGASQFGNWEEFTKKIGERRASGDKEAQQLYDAAFAADQQVKKSHEANLKILAANKGVTGVTSAVQGVANALSLVVDQNNTMLRTMSTKNQLDGRKMEEESIKKEQEEKEYKKYKEAVKKATENDRAHLKSIGVKIE